MLTQKYSISLYYL